MGVPIFCAASKCAERLSKKHSCQHEYFTYSGTAGAIPHVYRVVPAPAVRIGSLIIGDPRPKHPAALASYISDEQHPRPDRNGHQQICLVVYGASEAYARKRLKHDSEF